MGLLAHLTAISQVAVLVAAASSHVVTDPYVATQWNRCPSTCDSADSKDWDYYNGLRVLKSCDLPMLLNIAVNSPIANSGMRPELYACSLPSGNSFKSTKAQVANTPSTKYSAKDVEMEMAWRGEETNQYSPHSEAAARLVQAQFDQPAGQNATIAFGYSSGVVLGVYAGSMMDKTQDKSLLGSFLGKLRQGELSTSGSMMQVCNKDRPAAYNLGVISEASANPEEALATVQAALATWNRGDCVEGYSASRKSQVAVAEAIAPSHGNSSHISSHARAHVKKSFLGIQPRGECRTIIVKTVDDCSELASRCGISPADFTKYNPSKTLCSSLVGGQHVCCSAGTLPDFSPKPNADGTCATYTIQNSDYCLTIAAAHAITVDDINNWNAKTWGWQGCQSLPPNGKMCVSKGDPPMPAVLKNAVCGPQKDGTKRPADWDDIAGLNSCPLNACCDIWGQCGVTLEFCVATNSTTGAPGTAKNGTNGCISNCGTHIKLNSDAPSGPTIMAYYEAFNNQRPCLNLDVQSIDEVMKTGGENGSLEIDSAWSYIHFAFANITEDFKPDVSSVQDEFDSFKKLKAPTGYEGVIKQKILSFGGWSFSTDIDSYAIFRKGVTDAQRSLFATNVVSFANDNNLDGLDFDWEYPGAPDIPGIPAGDPGDGQRYLEFLKDVRDKLPLEKSLSVAVPSSYWYLKGFPIKEISDVVSYIVFMTYDLHGQWDWNNTNAADGCDGSACLRSHINETEIALAFSMITKAGVPNNKIFGGVASYGRSFGMKDPSCYGPECHFTGPESGARPGECTKTAGYIAEAEINEWLKGGDNITTYYDKTSASLISYSKDGNWVSYNNKANRTSRLVDWWINGHFKGTALWALDLTEFVSENADGTRISPIYPINCTLSFDNLDDLESASDIDDYCMNIYILQALSGNLTASLSKYQNELDDGYDKKFGWYEEAVRGSAPISLASFLAKNATKYFDCTITDMGKNYTDRGCISVDQFKTDCYWTAHNRTLFEQDLFEVSGISSDWFTYETYEDTGIRGARTGDVWNAEYYGQPHLKKDFKINNPKDAISKRMASITELQSTLDFTAFLANESMYMGDVSDAVDGASLAVFMISTSVTSMSQVADTGQHYEDDKVKNMILMFVTAVLFIIPGLEEGAVALELAEIANILRMIGTIGDVGMSAYDVVQAKDNAPAAVFGALLGGLGALNMLKAPGSLGVAAKARRGMSADHIEALGVEVKGGLGQVEKLIKTCF